MWIYDLETLRFLEVNNSAVQKYGYTRDEFLAMTIADIRPKEDRAALEKNVAAVTEGRSESGVWRHCLKSGQEIHVDITGHTIIHEGRRAELIAARDVSRLVRSEQIAREALVRAEVTSQELKRTKRILEIAGKAAQFGAWRYDITLDRVEWSAQTARIHDEPEGFSPSADQGIEYYAPEYRKRIRALFQACIQDSKSYDDIFEIITAKGRRVWVRATGEPERDEAGRIVAAHGSFQDISDLVAAQRSASELSNRLADTLENISDAFMLLDTDWCYLFLNAQAEALIGRSRNDLLGKKIWDAFPEATDGIFYAQYQRAMREGCSIRFQEFSAIFNKWFEVVAHPTSEGLAVYFRDVTEHRARDEQLLLLETAASRLNDVLLITEAEPFDDPDGPKIVYVNDAFVRRTGYSREEAIGKTPRILQGPKTQRTELDRIRRALESWQPVRAELVNYTKSGEEFWLELDIVPVPDEKGWFTHWVAVERDITDRKLVEKALKDNEERFRLVTKAAGSAIWDWDATTDLHWWSDGISDIFGHELTSGGSMQTAWRMHVHPDDLAQVDAAVERLMSSKDNSQRLQYRFRRANGSWATVDDHAFVMRDSEGMVLRVLGSMTDISEQKQLEDRLRQAQKMETVGQLTGGVAHDFNNLLTVILGNAELLEEALAEQPHLQKLAKMSLKAAERGADLTSRLLAFSRKQALQPRVIDLAQLVQSMDGLLRRTIPENISIEIVRGGGLWKVEVDATQLEAAILNLAVNARDAMPDGGCLTIEIANAMLDSDYVATEKDVKAGQYCVITITDTGNGIPPEHLDKVFEPFFTTKDIGKGSGLGLSMVFGFVKQSGGHIRVYSELGEGTSIKLYFPRSWAEQELTAANPLEREIIGGTETVLVVEDDRAVRDYAVTQLRNLGYAVIEASSGAEAIKLLQSACAVDLLFTDVIMPGMNGRVLAEAARKLRPFLKVLYTSGYTENSIVHNGRLDRGVKLLNKPYRRDQLAAQVREILDEK